jgi:hypothetical protein
VPSLRLLSLDARTFGGDRVALARSIASAEPDVACIHGAPHLLRWRSKCAEVGRRAGLVVVTGGRRAGANLLLSSLGVDVGTVQDLRFAEPSDRVNPPGAALAALQLRGVDFVLASTTLTGNAAVRLAQTGELQAAISRLVPGDLPSVISADGCDRAGTAAWQSLVENRVGVAGRIFVDGRVGVDEAHQIGGGPPVSPAMVIELTL